MIPKPTESSTTQRRNATDGKQATYWATEHYASPEFGGLKSGVGLVIDAGGAGQVKTMTVFTDTPGFVAKSAAWLAAQGVSDRRASARRRCST